MGRGNGRGNKRTMRRDFKDKRENKWSEKKAKIEFNTDLNNEHFEEYYKLQDIVPEGEWEEFMGALRKQLPTTFRINGSGQFASDMRDKLQSDFFSHFNTEDLTVDGEKVEAPRPLPWYPNNYAWQFDFSRTQLRKLPLLEGIHEFMKRATDAGTITRQEAVSMVPPLFLDVEPEHKVLDMCAAPGSKTFQLLEAVHASGGSPAGYVVANDADAQRCNLLTHQTKRMCSPCLLVTNHDAQHFPDIRQPGGGALAFDRILCDVPCSGDGTMRKAPDIWRRWSVNSGNGLHLLQIKIALQGAALLKVGGRMVYSTCTFNPIEDEAVVAEVLRRTGGSLQLVDVSGHLPALKRLPGKRHWKVRDKFRWYASWAEAEATAFKLDPSMFPPPPSDAPGAALPLERCMRFLPHHQNTGGFFVAVLEKVAPLAGPIQFPSSQHRFTKGRKGPGASAGIKEGAQAAAEAAVDALGKVLVAAEAGDQEAVKEGAVTARAAAARADLAVAAHNALGKEEAAAAAAADAAANDAADATPAADADSQNGTADAPADAAPMDTDEATPTTNGAASAATPADPTPTPAAPTPTPAAPADPTPADPNAPAAPSWIRGGGGRNRTGGGGRWRGIDPIIPVEDPVLLHMVTKFYGLRPDFPLHNNLIVRAQEPTKRPKRLYYIAPQIRDLLLADADEALKITSTGLKIFERQEVRDGTGQCCYRIAQEGLPFLLPHITQQRIQLPLPDLLRLLKERSVPIPFVEAPAFALDIEGATATTYKNTTAKEGAAAEAAAPAAPGDGEAEAGDEVPAEAPEEAEEGGAAAEGTEQAAATPKSGPCGPRGFENDSKMQTPEVLEQLKGISFGCAVATLPDAEARRLGLPTGDTVAGALTANAPLAICIWRAKLSINVLVSKPECAHMVEKIEAALAKAEGGKGEAAAQ